MRKWVLIALLLVPQKSQAQSMFFDVFGLFSFHKGGGYSLRHYGGGGRLGMYLSGSTGFYGMLGGTYLLKSTQTLLLAIDIGKSIISIPLYAGYDFTFDADTRIHIAAGPSYNLVKVFTFLGNSKEKKIGIGIVAGATIKISDGISFLFEGHYDHITTEEAITLYGLHAGFHFLL